MPAPARRTTCVRPTTAASHAIALALLLTLVAHPALAQSPSAAPILERTSIFSGELRAQTLAPFAVGRGDEASWRSAAATLHLDRPNFSLALDGGMLRDERSAWTSRSLVTATWYAPSVGPLRLALRGAGGDAPERPRWTGDASLSWRAGQGGAWIAAGADRDDAAHALRAFQLDGLRGDSAPRPATLSSSARATSHYSYGVWRQLGQAVVSVSVDARSLWQLGTITTSHRFVRVDSVLDTLTHRPIAVAHEVTQVDTTTAAMLSRASDAEARLVWSHARLALDLAAGQRSLQLTRGGFWAAGEASLALDRRLALVVGAGSSNAIDARPGSLAAPLLVQAGRPWLSFGVRVAPTALAARPRVREGVRPVASRFEITRSGDGMYAVIVTAPAARTVEVSGDFTGWTPIALAARADGRWVVTLPIAPGTHHVNLRVDGDRWIAPPGTTQVSDDFNGMVGVVVVR